MKSNSMLEILWMVWLLICHWPLILGAFASPYPSSLDLAIIAGFDIAWNFAVAVVMFKIASRFSEKRGIIAACAYIILSVIIIISAYTTGR